MKEVILNIYLIINDNYVVEFRGVAYEKEGSDEYKIKFLKGRAAKDLDNSYRFDAPADRDGNFMKYKKFARLEQRGKQFQLFEEIFSQFQVPEHPLICVTPVVDGKNLS
ncbi:MAG: hypothetical protein EHM47_17470 [Ignavibacteriales bacterium]|nr:MAG: hypothetical protein EHM47_17470 [Ignavibacteriales bacterium]